jgi:hypothetical protein
MSIGANHGNAFAHTCRLNGGRDAARRTTVYHDVKIANIRGGGLMFATGMQAESYG